MLRLRQICLVARDIDAVRTDLTDVFDISVSHVDPHVAQFGLTNCVLPVGNVFIEVVAPTREGTAAERYLDRRGGDGGYMTILNSDEIDGWRRHIADVGVREAAFLDYNGLNCIQMDPRDTGGSILEINRTVNGDDIAGPYVPAGPDWQRYVRTSRVSGLTGAELQSQTPERLARRWSTILKRGASQTGAHEWRIELDSAVLRFVTSRDGRGEGLVGVDITANDPAAIIGAARERGIKTDGLTVMIGGFRFYLVAQAGR